jgi:hypothetical protein
LRKDYLYIKSKYRDLLYINSDDDKKNILQKLKGFLKK